MTQKDKELLLKDLCARLPYHPIVYVDENLPRLKLGVATRVWEYVAVDKPCKPYLRPMSSMTEEERKELQEIAVALSYNKDDSIIGAQINSFRQLDGVLDLFNSHHLDWRGLIEKGLAIDCANLNIY